MSESSLLDYNATHPDVDSQVNPVIGRVIIGRTVNLSGAGEPATVDLYLGHTRLGLNLGRHAFGNA